MYTLVEKNRREYTKLDLHQRYLRSVWLLHKNPPLMAPSSNSVPRVCHSGIGTSLLLFIFILLKKLIPQK